MSSVVATSPGKPPTVKAEDLAAVLADISVAMRQLLRSGLNRKAILVLLAHSSGQPQRVCFHVLNSLEDLARTYASGGK